MRNRNQKSDLTAIKDNPTQLMDNRESVTYSRRSIAGEGSLTMNLTDYIDSAPIAILLLVVGLAFLGMCFGMRGCLSQLRAYRRELTERAKTLRIHRMLERLGVSLTGYVKRTPSIDVEKHLVNCGCCPDTDTCDDYLERGKDTDPNAFCPNFQDLQKYQSQGR